MTMAEIKICMIIGDPVKQSRGPWVYNNVFRQLKIDDEFVYKSRQIKPSELKKFIVEVKQKNIHGLSVTIPHKEAIMQYLDEIETTAQTIGAVNTVVNNRGKLIGYNTDWLGIAKPLQGLTKIADKNVAIIGAGGAARAAAYAIKKHKGHFTIYNRTLEKGQQIALELDGKADSFAHISSAAFADIIINATPVGQVPNETQTPLEEKFISTNQIIFDVISHPYETLLLKEAKRKGSKMIHGSEMWLYQGIEQFKLFTGLALDVNILRQEFTRAQEMQIV